VHLEQLSRQSFDLGEHYVRALADVSDLLAPGDGHGGEVAERDMDTRSPNVNAEDEARPGVEGHEAGSTTTRRRTDRREDNEPAVEELIHGLVNGRAAQPSRIDQFRTGEAIGATNDVQDARFSIPSGELTDGCTGWGCHARRGAAQR
jgi:hypothetical protein